MTGTYLPESNAILWYLAEGSSLSWLGDAARSCAGTAMDVFEQYSHEPYVANTNQPRLYLAGQLSPPPTLSARVPSCPDRLGQGPGGLRAVNGTTPVDTAGSS
jgi:hypothetical protein